MEAYRITRLGDKYKIDGKEEPVTLEEVSSYINYLNREVLKAVELGLAVLTKIKGEEVWRSLENDLPEKKIIIKNPCPELPSFLSFAMYKYGEQYFGVLQFKVQEFRLRPLKVFFYDSKENFENAFAKLLEKYSTDNPIVGVLVCERSI